MKYFLIHKEETEVDGGFEGEMFAEWHRLPRSRVESGSWKRRKKQPQSSGRTHRIIEANISSPSVCFFVVKTPDPNAKCQMLSAQVTESEKSVELSPEPVLARRDRRN